MTEPPAPSVEAAELLASYDHNGILGELTGVSLEERDRRARRVMREARANLAAARAEASATGRTVTIDAAPVTGVAAGDVWLVAPDGAVERQLECYRRAASLVASPLPVVGPTAPGGRIGELRPLLARCAYNGLWSPSGTNWQPMRTVELNDLEAKRLAEVAGWPAPQGAGALVLRRTLYESILGDVAALGGVRIEARAELIDAGIHRTVCALTAASHGCDPGLQMVASQRRAAVDREAAELVRRRGRGEGAETATALAEGLDDGSVTAAYGLFPRPLGERGPALDGAAVGGLATSELDRLVWSRASERVASPHRDLARERVVTLLEQARAATGAPGVAAIRWAVLAWHGAEVAAIGRAVHAALYGTGADPVGGAGGSGGLLAGITSEVVGAALGIATTDPRSAVPVAAVPPRLRQHVLAAQGYHRDGSTIVDRGGRPLTLAGLAQLVRVMTVGFGRHFLGFGATHPVTVVLLAPAEPLAPGVGDALGELVARVLLLARATGLVAVAKSGPTELARPAIDRIVAGTGDDGLRTAVQTGGLESALVVQLGWPLAPDDVVRVGTDTHDGLTERLHDRRAPRDRLARHYLAAPGRGS